MMITNSAYKHIFSNEQDDAQDDQNSVDQPIKAMRREAPVELTTPENGN
jgi:hypothetical protein